MSRVRRSRDEWREVIARQQGSGLTVAAFCRRAQLSPVSFFAWRRKLRAAVTFAEVKLAPPAAGALPVPAEAPRVGASGIEVHLPAGRWLMVRPGFDPQTLRDLLAALEVGA